jgi:hypothetical protein
MAKTTTNYIIMQHFWGPHLKDEFVFLFRNLYRDKIAAEPTRAGGAPYITPGVQSAGYHTYLVTDFKLEDCYDNVGWWDGLKEWIIKHIACTKVHHPASRRTPQTVKVE